MTFFLFLMWKFLSSNSESQFFLEINGHIKTKSIQIWINLSNQLSVDIWIPAEKFITDLQRERAEVAFYIFTNGSQTLEMNLTTRKVTYFTFISPRGVRATFKQVVFYNKTLESKTKTINLTKQYQTYLSISMKKM